MPDVDLHDREHEQESDLGELLGGAVDIVQRRRWWVIIPGCCIALAAIAAGWRVPSRYTSEATLMMVEQQVPQRYVVPNSTADPTSTLQAIKQEILSRTRLLRMIEDFSLYAKERQSLAPEQLVARMLSDIDVTPMGERLREKSFDTFRISFTTEDAALAQQVTGNLTSLFINEKLRSQEQQTNTTNKFLQDQLFETKKRLDLQEDRLREFKIQHVGELPEQQQGNLSILAGLQSQLQSTTTSLNRAQQQQSYLQSLLEARRPPKITASPAVPKPPTRAEAIQGDLLRLEAQRAQLLNKSYTLNHPDVIRLQREIAQAEDLLKRTLDQERPSSDATSASARTAAPEEDPALTQLKGQIDGNGLEIENLAKDERRLKDAITRYEGRITQTPVREQQQSSILRDTEALRLQYSDLQKHEQESRLATNLEKQQGGQQFRLLDAASFPLVPSSPKRLKQSLIGIAAGLFIGLALAFVVELRDTSFRTEKELSKLLPVPFLVEVPAVLTFREERQVKWRRTFEWLAGSAMVCLVMIAEYYVYKSR